jgi:predicted acyltransferase
MTETAPSRPVARETRASALDAMRGLAILAMLLSSEMPFGANSLPSWMYHAQVPPPEHKFIQIPGITWVDLVFPLFLFSMGAAFPLALGRRLRAGASEWNLAGSIFKRGFLLAFFALFVIAIRPYVLSDHPTTETWLFALLGFVILFPILVRLPKHWKPAMKWTIRGIGWIGAILFLGLAKYPDGSGFRLERTDIIIVVLANMAVWGALIWLVTRDRILPRLGIIGILLAIRLSNMPHPLGGWVTDFWNFSPEPWVSWIYKLYYLQYLCIVLPGTVAGDLLFEWGRAPQSGLTRTWQAGRLWAIGLLMFAFVLILLIGLKSRWLPDTPLVVFPLCVCGWFLVHDARTPTERLYKSLFLWGAYWMVLGLFLEPYEGGIRKDKATVSYYFVTSGLANWILIGFSIIIDSFKRERWLGLLIETGRNPMIAYAGVNNFINPLFALTGLAAILDQWASTPWRGFWRGVLVTLSMAVVTTLLTRKKIFWRT